MNTEKLLLELIDKEVNELLETTREKGAPIKSVKGEALELFLPKFIPTEGWGDPRSQDRRQIESFVRAIPGAGLKGKITQLERIMDPKQAKRFGTRRVISSLVLLESLSALINDFSPSSSGFIFEGYLAALLGGEQKAEAVGGSLPIEDIYIYGTELGGGKPVSLKLLTKGGDVKGSFKNLVDGIFGKFGEMPYFVVYKDGDFLKFYQFFIGMDNLTAIFLEDERNLRLLGEKKDQEEILELSHSGNFDLLYDRLKTTPGYLREKQWYLSAGKITDPSKGGPLRSEYIAEIEINQEKLQQLSAAYVEQIGEYVTKMFNSLKSLSENINFYVTKKNRAAATESANAAAKDARGINQATLKQIQKDKAEE